MLNKGHSRFFRNALKTNKNIFFILEKKYKWHFIRMLHISKSVLFNVVLQKNPVCSGRITPKIKKNVREFRKTPYLERI
jgi:type II secretory pathway component HofQ